MARRAALIAVTVTLSALASVVPTALAGTFSLPLPLPGNRGSEWHFAVNDRGQGAAIQGSENGALVYPLEPIGGLGSPLPLVIPGRLSRWAGPLEQSIAIDSRGRVAVGLLYKDGTLAPSSECVEHCGPGCCRRVALASWQLGQPPPTPQVLSPKQGARAGVNHQVFEAPSILIGPSAITALWMREEPEVAEPLSANEPEPNETQLEEAYGRFSEPLHVKRVTTAPRGVSYTHLGLARNGDPIASWVEDGNKLLSVKGLGTGALRGPKHVRLIPRLSQVEGFANEAGPDALLAYFSDSHSHHHHHRSRLMMMRSRAGLRLSAPSKITLIQEATEATLAVGGRSLLAVWGNIPGFVGEEDHLYVQHRSLSGRFGAREALGLGSNSQAFLDSHGQSVIIYRRPVTHSTAYETVAVTAAPGHHFGPARPLAPNLDDCQPKGGGPFGGQPLARSPDGHAVFSVKCGEEEHQYLIRYTP